MKEPLQRKILILYTGGTIGMKPIEGSGRLAPGSLQDLQANLPEIAKLPYQIEWQEYTQSGKLIDSSNATMRLYNDLGREIVSKQADYDGIVILFGTDTMGPSAAALAYELEGVQRPVIFTGAMNPAAEPNSDGPRNVRDAVQVAGQSGNEISAINEVTVCFAGKLFRGVHARKYAANQLDAFESVGRKPLAVVSEGGNIVVDESQLLPPHRESQTKFRPLKENLKIFPINVCLTTLESKELIAHSLHTMDAVVLFEIPIDPPLTAESPIVKLIEKVAPDKPVFCVGRDSPLPRWVRMAGVNDLQQAHMKAWYILSQTNDIAEIKCLSESNLRGEVPGSVVKEEELLTEIRLGREGALVNLK